MIANGGRAGWRDGGAGASAAHPGTRQSSLLDRLQNGWFVDGGTIAGVEVGSRKWGPDLDHN